MNSKDLEGMSRCLVVTLRNPGKCLRAADKTRGCSRLYAFVVSIYPYGTAVFWM
jgi:hypothetical protein